MATVNMKVLIRRPGFDKVTALPLTTVNALDEVRIPRRVPFADIINFQSLKDNGFIRGENQNVSTKYGGNNEEGGLSNFGLTLPRTEKLILIAKNPGTTKVEITLSGNERLGIQNQVIELPANEVSGLIYEIDLFDLGFHIESNVEGSVKLTPKQDVDMVLIARY